MSYWAASKLRANGEINWERNIWDDSQMMECWMMLATFQRYGIEFAEVDGNG
jgi:hypothetical protein